MLVIPTFLNVGAKALGLQIVFFFAFWLLKSTLSEDRGSKMLLEPILPEGRGSDIFVKPTFSEGRGLLVNLLLLKVGAESILFETHALFWFSYTNFFEGRAWKLLV